MSILGGSFYEGSRKTNKIVYIWPDRQWRTSLDSALGDSPY